MKKPAKLTMLILLAFLSFSSYAKHPERYVFGVFPYLPTLELEKIYSPIAKEFSIALNREVVFKTTTLFGSFNKRLDSEEYDIVLLQPFDYIRAADHHRYVPLATRVEELAGIITVKEGSDIKTVGDLKNKTIALPPKKSAVSRLVKQLLLSNGINPGKDVTLDYKRSHTSCLKQVHLGKADACGTAPHPRRLFQQKMKTRIDIIGETPSIPHTLFAAHSRIPEKDREKIIATILSWDKTATGKKILERGKLTPYKRVKNSDYDSVRQIEKQTRHIN